MLLDRLGARRISPHPAAVDAIIARCAGLPLALAVTAARAAVRPNIPLAAVAAELESSDGLAPFVDRDPAVDLRAVLSCSYRVLTAAGARLFRLLSTYPGPELGAAAAVSLAGGRDRRGPRRPGRAGRRVPADRDLPWPVCPARLAARLCHRTRQRRGTRRRPSTYPRPLSPYGPHRCHRSRTAPRPDQPAAGPPGSDARGAALAGRLVRRGVPGCGRRSPRCCPRRIRPSRLGIGVVAHRRLQPQRPLARSGRLLHRGGEGCATRR